MTGRVPAGRAGLRAARELLASQGLPSEEPVPPPDSAARFPDGRRYRIEIPSVEGPEALEAVLSAAADEGVRIDRISQGSGVMLLRDAELARMAELGARDGVEVVLWSGLRSAWDAGAQARASSGSVSQASVRGTGALAAGVEEALRAAEAGIDGVLVADLGLLAVLGGLKRSGDLPASFVLKVSISLPVANPATARTLVGLGATTLNLPVDLPLATLAAIRSVVDVPLDVYVEGSDDFAAPLRYHELAELVRAAAPVHVKFAVRNAAPLYPSGAHLQALAVASARERVRRAAIAMETLARQAPELVEEPPPAVDGAAARVGAGPGGGA